MQILFYLWFPSVYYAKTKQAHDQVMSLLLIICIVTD